MIDETTLRSWAGELGFAELALCSADAFEEERQQVLSQPPLGERKQLCFDPKQDDPRTKSLAVMLWPYAQRSAGREDDLFVDGYYFASNAAYHAARALEARICESGHFAKANVSYPAKAAAMRAGLGLIGGNGLLHTKRFGTRVVIILMASDIMAQSVLRRSGSPDACLQCGRCAKACPSGALDGKGMSHPERCLRNYMMEGVVVPEALRKKMGMSLIGCDVCQRVCPMQMDACAQQTDRFALKEFLHVSSFADASARLAREIGRNAARPQRIRAQAALLAGNSAKEEYLPLLRQWADSEFEAVREHARWAIEQIELARRRT